MAFLAFGAGLTPDFRSPPEVSEIEDIVTEEAAVRTQTGQSLRVTPLVAENDFVAKGAAVACLRHAPDVCFVAPFAGRVGRVSLLPGRKLSEIVLFREESDAVEHHDTDRAATPGGLQRLMQSAGFWPRLRRRPFGGMPDHAETPAAILVMAADTRPFAPDPRLALKGREEDLARGLAALARLTAGPVFFCRTAGPPMLAGMSGDARIHEVICGARHPQGSAGIRIHQLFPAGLDAPVWDVHAEDVAALGALLARGTLPMTRLVHISGSALRRSCWVRTHPGADLRQLTQRIVLPSPHLLMSGSPLDGHAARWLAPRHRQVTVLPRAETSPRAAHWLVAALTRSVVGRPAIPTAALTHAFGAVLPATPFVRALSAGDDETAMKLGVLSLLEEDIALADYVLSEGGQLAAELRGMLDRIQNEFAA
ncbi:Na(+)-translocating NADH-quinone reductase subunit A [Aestuariicoccus sp. MJ-SS9]|uniref:Na(+)-translocating NADH-quinone reductase subunit A n=1 Tax=Aestuariicoccus sp. MJ-SS9 TaxID=3079855 RepID=UPI00290FBE3A|nr:Na(+)-translocating NADH-quinone reductase subunit A [Aestuariicoccus sp. MJ-SS9]MDU8913069.1 Na(+)-translocating NADH-quinone reductase subunit A [Aestuariicoccus sp. MJ-SS9]